MKKYISAQMNIVRLGNDIVTASPTTGWDSGSTDDPNAIEAPSRYGRGRYDAEYDLY